MGVDIKSLLLLCQYCVLLCNGSESKDFRPIGHKRNRHSHITAKSQMPLTCSVLAVGPNQVLAFGHNHCEALCCRQIAERQQDLPNCIHSLRGDTRARQTLNITAGLGDALRRGALHSHDVFHTKANIHPHSSPELLLLLQIGFNEMFRWFTAYTSLNERKLVN